MMTDAILQTLLILAYLAIGLIAVTFPIYAICVVFLPQEKWESEKNRKRRIEELKEHLTKLAEELSGEPKDSERFKEIQDRMESHEEEKESLEYLTAKGAVKRPVILLALALIAAVIGIQTLHLGFMEVEFASLFVVLSGVFSARAIYRLYKTIAAVEYAALRPARTIEFGAFFDSSGKDSEEIKLRKPAKLEIMVGTDEESLEQVEISVFFPPEIEVKEVLTKHTISVVQSSAMRWPGYAMISRTSGFLHSASYDTITVSVLPNKIGKFTLPIAVCAKGISEFHTSLIVNVVK